MNSAARYYAGRKA